MWNFRPFSPLGVPLIRQAGPAVPDPPTFATVLCANLHGYDALGALLQPGRIAPLLEDYFALLTDAVLEFGGQIFHLADADLMAGFGLGDERHTQIREALGAARAIQSRFSSWRGRWAVEVGIGIGLHRGEFGIAASGQSAEGGLVIVGDTASLAIILSRRARAGEILLTTTVHGPFEHASTGGHGGGPYLVGLAGVRLPGCTGTLGLWCIPAAQRRRPAREGPHGAPPTKAGEGQRPPN